MENLLGYVSDSDFDFNKDIVMSDSKKIIHLPALLIFHMFESEL